MLKITQRSSLAAAAMIALTTSTAALASTYTTVNLPTLNTNITTYDDGSAYDPLFTGSSTNHTLGGIPFTLQSGNGNNAFIGALDGTSSLDMPVDINDATTIYTLINTGWGEYGSDVGSLTFTGSGGASYTVQLVEGNNVRDHFYGAFVNTTSDPSTKEAVWGINTPGNAHLDMQAFKLPSQFYGQTLTDIVFNTFGGYPQGDPFIVGATVASGPVSATPLPGSLSLMLPALGLMGIMLRRKSRA